MSPLVTVFTLIYNTRVDYIIEAIESVQRQTYKNIQHIVIDDCSADTSTFCYVKQWIVEKKYICELYRHDFNYGLCKSLNHVLKLAKGEYIIGCCDDVLVEDAIESQLKYIDSANSTCRVVFGRVQTFGDDINAQIWPLRPSLSNFNSLTRQQQFEELAKENFVPALGVLIAVSLFQDIGNYDEDLKFEDYDLWLRALTIEKIYFHDKILGFYRIHSASISSTIGSWDYDFFKILIKHVSNSRAALLHIESIVYNAYINSDYRILNSITRIKGMSLKLMVIWFFDLICFPKYLGKWIVWRI